MHYTTRTRTNDTYRTTYLLRPQTQSNLLILLVQNEYPVFDFVSPQQFVALQMLDAVVRGYELPHSRLADVIQILLGFIPWLGHSYF